MPKYYYQTLSKEEKKKVKKEYQKEYQETEIMERFRRLNIYAIIAILFGLFLIIYAYFFENKNIGSIILGITMLILALVFIIGKALVKLRLLNKVALNQKRKKVEK